MKRNIIKNILNKGELYVCGVLVYALIFVSFSSVLSRYILPSPLTWSEELSRYLFIWLTFLSFSYAVTAGAHLAVDAIFELLLKNKPRVVRVMKLLANAVFMAFCIVFGYIGYKAMMFTVEYSPAMNINMKYIYAAVPVGCGLATIRLLQNSIFLIKQPWKKQTAQEEN